MEKEFLKGYRVQIGKQLNMMREAQGWSVEQVATMADVKPVTIEKIEEGAFNVPFDLLVSVAEVLGAKIVLKERS